LFPYLGLHLITRNGGLKLQRTCCYCCCCSSSYNCCCGVVEVFGIWGLSGSERNGCQEWTPPNGSSFGAPEAWIGSWENWESWDCSWSSWPKQERGGFNTDQNRMPKDGRGWGLYIFSFWGMFHAAFLSRLNDMFFYVGFEGWNLSLDFNVICILRYHCIARDIMNERILIILGFWTVTPFRKFT